MTDPVSGLPATAACGAAQEVARAYLQPWLYNHSVRSYIWAVALAERDGIAFDAELLYVSALLHDIGLVQEFDNHALPFEVAGGHVARVFAAGAGWTSGRGIRAAEVIERHMWPSVDVTADPEGYLLEAGTGADISGLRTDDLPSAVRERALGQWPRLTIADQFTACFRDQASRKPDSAAARILSRVESGLANHPYEPPS